MEKSGENPKGFIYVVRKTLPEAWEAAVLETWEKGRLIPTEYDKPEDPNSRDVTATIIATNPQQEPRIHRAFPGGLNDLETYRQEVLYGVRDHWVNPTEGKWSYTYHQRMFAHPLFDKNGNQKEINQFDYIINKLAEAPHTRRAQATTWKVDVDPEVDDCACLQRMWFRIFDDLLQLDVNMRSNDAFKAAFMNMWGFTDLQRYVAEEVSKKLGREIKSGPYVHVVDSFHIYGSYFKDFMGFIETTQKRKFEERVWDSRSEIAQSNFYEAKVDLLNQGIGTDKQLPLKHQIRLYSGLPLDLREKVDERVRSNLESLAKQ